MSETIQIMSTPLPYSSIFKKMIEGEVTRSMAVPKEYLKYNGKKELHDEYLYLNTHIIYDPIAYKILWEGIRNNLKKKIANSNATTFIEVNDEC